MEKLTEEYERLDNKARFVAMVVSGELRVGNRKKKDLLQDLDSRKFKKFYRKSEKEQPRAEEASEEDEEGESGEEQRTGGYDYLLSLPLWSLTKEKVDQLNAKRNEKEEELRVLIALDPKDMWRKDLDEMDAQLVVRTVIFCCCCCAFCSSIDRT